MVIRTKVGRKGYLILPKKVREAVGIEEGDEVIIEVGEGIIIRPARRPDLEELRKRLKIHVKMLRALKLEGPRLGDLKGIRLEEEFDEALSRC